MASTNPSPAAALLHSDSNPKTQQQSISPQSPPPPSKQSLGQWWKHFKKNNKKEDEIVLPPSSGIFGVPLHVSIKYANVAISLTDNEGNSFIYGYVPIVVAKCGVFLKEKAVDVEGIFRLSGSAKRIKELQALFDSPDRYGKGLDWTGFTVHDAANILRRYLNMLPEPIIPSEFYELFRDPIRGHQREAVGNPDGTDVGGFDIDEAIKRYQDLITQIPPLNRQLLLYVLDLLAVFASKSDLNRMPSANLAAIFQPGALSHTKHDLAPDEYKLSQDVLIFLIENQDHFLIGMTGTAADEKTVQEVQQGGTPPVATPTASLHRHSQSMVVRSSSNASAGAESIRKYGGIRRNVSVSSKHSSGAPSPSTPSNQASPGVQRSNTVPSRKSPALASQRFNMEPATPTHLNNETASGEESARSIGTASSRPQTGSGSEHAASGAVREPAASENMQVDTPFTEATSEPAGSYLSNADDSQSSDRLLVNTIVPNEQSSATTPNRDRTFPNIFASKSPTDGEKSGQIKPNKLRKKRMPGSTNQSAHSSTNSLSGAQILTDSPTSHPPSSSLSHTIDADRSTDESAQGQTGTQFTGGIRQSSATSETAAVATAAAATPIIVTSGRDTLKPNQSPTNSTHSRSSVTDHSDFEHLDNTAVRSEHKERRFGFRRTSGQKSRATPSPNRQAQKGLGLQPQGTMSDESFKSSSGQPRSSFANDSGTDRGLASSTEPAGGEQEKKGGPIKWLKTKVREAKDERKEREAERERAKSPPPSSLLPTKLGSGQGASKQSLSMIATSDTEASHAAPQISSSVLPSGGSHFSTEAPRIVESSQETPAAAEAQGGTLTVAPVTSDTIPPGNPPTSAVG